MQRGRRYARAGQVLSFDVQPGVIVAQVQGSRRTPYVVTVAVTQPTAEQWASVDAAARVSSRLRRPSARGRGAGRSRRRVPRTRRSSCSLPPGRRSTLAVVVPIGRTRVSTSPRCCICSPTGSTATLGCCSLGTDAAATNSSTRCAPARVLPRRPADRRSRPGGHSRPARTYPRERLLQRAARLSSRRTLTTSCCVASTCSTSRYATGQLPISCRWHTTSRAVRLPTPITERSIVHTTRVRRLVDDRFRGPSSYSQTYGLIRACSQSLADAGETRCCCSVATTDVDGCSRTWLGGFRKPMLYPLSYEG